MGRILPIGLCKLCVIRVRGPNSVGRAVANGSNIVALCFGDHGTCIVRGMLSWNKVFLFRYRCVGSGGGGGGGAAPPGHAHLPPEMTCVSLIQLVFCQRKQLCGLLVLK